MNDYATGKAWKEAKQQHILETAYELFSQKGIEQVSIPEIATKSGVGRATVFRYFTTKLDLVIAIGTWKWEEYILEHDALLSEEEEEDLTGAELLEFYLDAFIDLYRNHADLLRFNYNFNSFLRYEAKEESQKNSYMTMVDRLEERFHGLFLRGIWDGTLNPEYTEAMMFSSSFHIMLAAVTRYAVGLVYMPKVGTDAESELLLLKEMLLDKFTRKKIWVH